MYKCIFYFTFWTLLLISSLSATDDHAKLREQVQSAANDINVLKSLHFSDVTRLRKDIEELKARPAMLQATNNHERNEKETLRWAMKSMDELRTEMKEMRSSINNSVLLHQLHVIRNELKQALSETTDLSLFARTQEARVDKLDSEISRLKYEFQQMRTMMADLHKQFKHFNNEIKSKADQEWNNAIKHPSDVVDPNVHKYRHNKMVHVQISRLAKTQNQLDMYQSTLQSQILGVQQRLDKMEDQNWNLLSAKQDFTELEVKILKDKMQNTTQKVSDFDKMHASILELREDIESIENKADKIVPEFRKEISKLDVNYAQLNAQSSYLKEDQENLRQSVKAIAVSVSNTIDKAEIDRIFMKNINDSIADLQTRTKQHFSRLNDHILKSESNNVNINNTSEISLPELMGEVKELQPMEKEYEHLINKLPHDCSTITGPTGTYLIHPGRTPIDTWCVDGGTVLQRRYNGSIEFNRNFVEYANGFGNPSSEFWIGLNTMHLLTSDNCSSMRIDMTDIYGAGWYAEYEHFSVGSADTGYVLEVSGFKGNASDAFEYQNHMEFSAIDHDRDISNTHCAGNYEGGWWFSHCQHVNINGKYSLGLTWFDSGKNEWIAVASSEMRMYRTC